MQLSGRNPTAFRRVGGARGGNRSRCQGRGDGRRDEIDAELHFAVAGVEGEVDGVRQLARLDWDSEFPEGGEDATSFRGFGRKGGGDGERLPKPGPQADGGALFHQDAPSVITKDHARESHSLALGLHLGAGDLGLASRRLRTAESGEGAGVAGGRFRGADGRAEFHQGLIEHAGAIGAGHERRGPLPRPVHRGLVAGSSVAGFDAQEDADDVAVHERGGLSVGDGGDGAGGVRPDAGDRPEGLDVAGDSTSVVVDDGLCGGVEEPGSAVIAQARPEGEDVFDGSGGEVGERWITGEEEGELVDDAGDLGLLEHQLTEERVIRIAPTGRSGASPGKVAHGAIKPRADCVDDLRIAGEGRRELTWARARQRWPPWRGPRRRRRGPWRSWRSVWR